MLIEVILSWVDKWGFLVSCLNLLALITFSYLTYQLAKETQEFFVSFSLSQIENSHIGFGAINKSKAEVEVFSKVWVKVDNQIFQFKKGFYANDTNWILQPFTEGGGHFWLKDLKDNKEFKLENFVNENNLDLVRLKIQIKYRKVGSKKWKKSSPQTYAYKFKTQQFWLDV